jgi:hypothetical protein
VGGDNHASPAPRQRRDRWHRGADADVVNDLVAVVRDVEVRAHQHGPALDPLGQEVGE